MRITDAQIHIWNDGTASLAASVFHRPLRPETVLEEMDLAGVDRAVAIPPKSGANEFCLDVANQHRDRFGVMLVVPLADRQRSALIADWTGRPSAVLGVRLTFPPWSKPSWLEDGTTDWYWPIAARHEIPTMIWAPGQWRRVAEIAEAYPRLPIAIDHMGLHVDDRDADVATTVQSVLEMAQLPNISVKATAVPNHSSEPYPHRDMSRYVESLVTAFGPKRVFWGSDMTALHSNYRQTVSMFTESMPWLDETTKEWIMGEGISEWLRWP
jgi:L-fuconolactonase